MIPLFLKLRPSVRLARNQLLNHVLVESYKGSTGQKT